MASSTKPSTSSSSPGEYIERFPLKRLRESATNPRRIFGKLDELAVSIKRHGVLEPLLVRPVPGKPDTEIVAGHRRFRAATIAGVEHVRVILRELSDSDALEIQLIENVQREDLHELDEADGYAQLIERCGYTPATLAEKVGVSKATIHARLKLRSLGQACRDAWLNGELDASRALYLARIPTQALQEQALEEITKGTFNDGPMSAREAQAHIAHHYTIALDERARFDTADETLDPVAGPCITCPKLSGNARDLFPEIQRADVCTDPECFKGKSQAHWNRTAEKAARTGLRVLSAKEAKNAIDPYGPTGRPKETSGYAALDQQAPWVIGRGKTWKQLLGKKAPAPTVIARDPRTGDAVQLIERNRLEAVAKEHGIGQPTEEERRARDEAKANLERANKKAEADQRAQRDVALALVAAAEAGGGEQLWPLVAAHLITIEREGYSDNLDETEMAQRRGLDGAEDASALLRALPTMKSAIARGVAVEVLALTDYTGAMRSELCKLLGVDPKRPKTPAKKSTAKAAKKTPAKKSTAKAAKKTPAKKSTAKAAKKTPAKKGR
ncbi:MAG: ParB/RepB/Spo0J family partition protein [Deltaproteobacteria bacterium]|nr:ParB/RepB/Spo0J family partition protein [Deltaproteobacteria bacterium]